MAPHLDSPPPVGSFSNGVQRTSSRPDTPNFTQDVLPLSTLSQSLETLSMNDDFHLKRPLVPGVYVPTLVFFDEETEDLDTSAIAHHAVQLARAGVTGLATQGSNGEAVHLTHVERQLVTFTTRKALNEAGFSHMPIIVGCGSQSTRETIEYCREARKAGGDYALVLPPSYYAGMFTPASGTIIDYFTEVADASPIPLIIYNYPAAVNGGDLSSNVVSKLAQHSNIAGVKLTCGNTGKLNRVAAAARKMTKNYDHDNPKFLVLAGSADFAMQSLVAGGHGMIAGLANVAPKACVKIIELYRAGRLEEAMKLQDLVSLGDWTAIQGGVVGVKAGLQAFKGYGGYARRPLPRPTPEQTKQVVDGFKDLLIVEQRL